MQTRLLIFSLFTTVLPWQYVLVLFQEMFPQNQSPKGEHEGLDYTASGLTFDTDLFDSDEFHHKTVQS